MRQIKFRAWDKELKKMVYVDTIRFCRGEPFAVLTIDADGNVKDNNIENVHNNPPPYCVLLQFTGLLDKNGKEIYQGDRFQTKYGTKGVVKFSQVRSWHIGYFIKDGLHFDPKQSYDDTEKTVALWEVNQEGEIIGTIFDNPDQSKKEK